MLNHSTEPKQTESKSNIGLFIFLPIFIIVFIYFIIPFVTTIIRSFTDYHFIETPKFIGLENYLEILQTDKLAKITFKNSFISTFLATIITVISSFGFAYFTSKCHKFLKYTLSILFMIVSISTIIPAGLYRLLTYNNNSLNSISLLQTAFVLKVLPVLVPFLMGIGPLFILFTISFINKGKLKNYFHLAVSLQVILCFLSFNSIERLTYYPSYLYYADTLGSYIRDLIFIRFQVGYASALLVIMGLMIAFFIFLFNGIVSFVFNKFDLKTNQEINYSSRSNSILYFILILFVANSLLIPNYLLFIDSFKPLDEIFAYPPHLIPKRITLQNYTILKEMYGPMNRYIFNTFFAIILSSLIMFLVNVLSSVGFMFVKNNVSRTLLRLLTYSFILTPMVLLTINRNQYESYILTIIGLTFQGCTFGLSIFISKKIMDNCSAEYINFTQFISSRNVVKYGYGILSLSVLGSLSSIFSPVKFIYNESQLNLFHLIELNFNHGLSRVGTSASLSILSMMIPISIIIICVPLLMNSLSKEKQ